MLNGSEYFMCNLSIITVNFNNSNGLKKTIESVLSQKLISQDSVEYLIIDGGSSDDSVEVIKEFSNRTDLHLRITDWISEKDKGIYNAMNKGIGMSHGKYVIFMNSGDVFYSENILESVLKKIENAGNSILYGDTFYDKPDNQGSFWYLPDELTLNYLCEYGICHQSTFIPLKLLKENLYDESLFIAADLKFNIQSYLSGIAFLKMNIVVSSLDMTGISNTNIERSAKERELIVSSLVPLGMINEMKKIKEETLSIWINYYKSLIRNRTCYTMALFMIKIVNKIGKIFHFLHD